VPQVTKGLPCYSRMQIYVADLAIPPKKSACSPPRRRCILCMHSMYNTLIVVLGVVDCLINSVIGLTSFLRIATMLSP